MKDKVTISLYSIETNDAVGYKAGFLNEFDNIQKIRNGLCKAAEESKREAPEFIVSVLLVPDWDRQNNSYKDEQYLANKSKFVEAAKNKFEAINDVKVEDFYFECRMMPEERAYMHNLKAMGSNAVILQKKVNYTYTFGAGAKSIKTIIISMEIKDLIKIPSMLVFSPKRYTKYNTLKNIHSQMIK